MGLFQHHGQRSHPVASGPQGLALGFFGVRWSLGLRGCGASTKSFHDRTGLCSVQAGGGKVVQHLQSPLWRLASGQVD